MAQVDPLDAQLRPANLDSIIGQEAIKASLRVFVQAANMRNEPLPHVLLRGGPGLGKTTFALAIGAAQGSEVVVRIGPALNAAAVGNLIKLKLAVKAETLRRFNMDTRPKLVFIDEVHAVPSEGLELLYPLMEDFTYGGRTIARFTLIAATTDPGKLPAPFMDRFGINYLINLYPEDELVQILNRSYGVMVPNGTLGGEAAMALAKRSRGTPRRANRILARAVDYMMANGEPTLTAERVAYAMRAMEIDRFGLEAIDRTVIQVMAERFDRPVGLASIAAAVGEDARNIERTIEPYLVRAGFVNRTRSGRELTDEGKMVAAWLIEGKVEY